MGIQYSLLSNIVKAHVIITVHLLFLSASVLAQNSGIKPQYWNNATIGWLANENLLVGNTLSYNVLVDKDLPWSEVSNNTTAAFQLKSFLILNGGLYIANTKQSKSLTSLELRPYMGIRVSTKTQRRWILSNLSRIEWRNLSYSDDTHSSSFRFRNRTTGVLALNHHSILDDNTLSIFAYLEAFHNFEKDVVERYFTTLKYKAGIAYRFSPQWRINLGALFNNARSTIADPSQSPTNVVTNFILEWGVTYTIVER